VKFIAGFVVALAIVAGAALAIMYTGSYNVAASVPDNPIVEWTTTRPAFIATLLIRELRRCLHRGSSAEHGMESGA
jgi:hypothetical protein